MDSFSRRICWVLYNNQHRSCFCTNNNRITKRTKTYYRIVNRYCMFIRPSMGSIPIRYIDSRIFIRCKQTILQRNKTFESVYWSIPVNRRTSLTQSGVWFRVSVLVIVNLPNSVRIISNPLCINIKLIDITVHSLTSRSNFRPVDIDLIDTSNCTIMVCQ